MSATKAFCCFVRAVSSPLVTCTTEPTWGFCNAAPDSANYACDDHLGHVLGDEREHRIWRLDEGYDPTLYSAADIETAKHGPVTAVTADNITDAQIHQVWRNTKGRGAVAARIREVCRSCFVEGEHEAAVSLRTRSRAYVAGVLNSRARHVQCSGCGANQTGSDGRCAWCGTQYRNPLPDALLARENGGAK